MPKKLKPKALNRRQLLIGPALACFLVGLLLNFFSSHYQELKSHGEDWIVRNSPAPFLPSDFVLLAIDEAALNPELISPRERLQSRPLQLISQGFPYPRELYAHVLERLLSVGAKVVIIDLIFDAPKAGDTEFATAIRKWSSQAVLASHFDFTESAGGVTAFYVPLTNELRLAARYQGFVNMLPGRGGPVRQVLLNASSSSIIRLEPLPGETTHPSLVHATMRSLELPFPKADSREPLQLKYSRLGSVDRVSLPEIFLPGFWERNFGNGEFFRNKTVILGPTATRFQDYHLTPWGTLIPGPELHLHILACAQRNQWLHALGWPGECAGLLIGIGLAFFFSWRFQRTWLLLLSAGGVLLLGVAAAIFAYYSLNMLLPLTSFLLGTVAMTLCGEAVNYTTNFLEKNRFRRTLERYVSRDVVRDLLDNPTTFLEALGGTRRDVVILFSDLRGFTTSVENASADQLVARLNRYFSAMVEIVFRQQGTVDKFIGDALMATWGGIRSSGPQGDRSQALQAATAMLERLESLNKAWEAEGLAHWQCGIGLASGSAIFGNIGSPEKMEPTVIGDAVNLASRLESLTKLYQIPLLVSEDVAEKSTGFSFFEVDRVRVKGRTSTERLFGLFHAAESEALATLSSAKEQYYARHFRDAAEAFSILLEHPTLGGIARVFHERTRDFLKTPPPADWDGVAEMREK